MAEPMSAERYLERWQNYRNQPQQVAAVRALHAAIAALEGGQQILDEQAPWAQLFSTPPTPATTPKPQPKKSGAVALGVCCQ